MSVGARGAPNWPLKRRVHPDALCCKCLIWFVRSPGSNLGPAD